MAVVVPPRTWVELATQHVYTGVYLHFWLTYYFRVGTLAESVMPTLNHLWFVAYLWVYTLVLAGIAALPVGTRAQAWFDRAFGGWLALVLPALYLVLLEAVIFRSEEHTSELQSLMRISYAVFCLKKKKYYQYQSAQGYAIDYAEQ